MNQPYPYPERAAAAEAAMTQQPTRKARKGMAITALVLGIVALAGSPIPILNNATIIVGFIGVVFGIIGLFGTHRLMAGFGLAFSIAGIVVGLVLQAQWGKQLDQIGRDLNSGTPATLAPSTAYHYTAPSPSAVTPPPIKPGDFTVGLKITSKQCFGSYGCNLVVEPTITYAGTADQLSAYGLCSITYTITGNKDGDVTETAYGTGGTQFQVTRSVLSTASAKVTPTATVTDVTCQ